MKSKIILFLLTSLFINSYVNAQTDYYTGKTTVTVTTTDVVYTVENLGGRSYDISNVTNTKTG